MNRTCPVLAIVVPCYNEEEALSSSIDTLAGFMEQLKADNLVDGNSFIVFVDDGSHDATWRIIEQKKQLMPDIAGIKLSFNAGHQAALMAGLMESRAQVDCSISIDADLQHDISVIPAMLRLFAEGKDIVAGVRLNRAGDSRIKGILSDSYYKFMKKLGTPLDAQHADFRLLGRNVLDALSCYSERNLFLRGIIASMGFNTATVSFVQKPRALGQSKYSWFKMISLVWNGIASLSTLPLRLSVILSLLTLLLALAVAVSAVVDYLYDRTVTGWSSIMLTVLFLGATQLFCIALVGEYLAKIYIEVKRRPTYIVEKKI